jgi:exonuclease SbcC
VSACERAAADERAAEAALAAADGLVVQSQQAHAAAFAAQNRSAGDDCPICNRPLPVDFTPPLAADLERAQRAANGARKAAQAAHNLLATAQAAHAAAVQSHAEAVVRTAAKQAALDDALHEARAAGLDPAAAENSAALTTLRAASVACQSAFEAADEARRQADARVAALRATHVAAIGANDRAKHELASCRVRVEAREQQLRTLLDSLPPALTPALEPDAIERIAREVSAALEDARRFAEMRNDAALAAKAAEAELHRLEGRRALEIFAPTRTLRSNLIAGTIALAGSAHEIETARIESLPPSPPEDAGLANLIRWALALGKAVSTALQAIDAATAADAQQAQAHHTGMAELLRARGVPDSAALAALRDEALQAEAMARQTLEFAQAALREATELDAQLARLEPLARALDALHSALGDGKFKRFVAARKEQRLLGVATTILGRMTDERYGFGPAMRIVDRSAGQERSPQTLSGGEKFLASLALAFALVEIAARSGGHFGALFLDEGFGSLDVHALDQALAELERQATGGRMIGVITHVREVTEYIDDVLRVWRTPSGSDIARLKHADLDALVAETATLAIGGA